MRAELSSRASTVGAVGNDGVNVAGGNGRFENEMLATANKHELDQRHCAKRLRSTKHDVLGMLG